MKVLPRRKKNVSLMLDSGAFSAWTKNAQIDIQEYIQFIKDHLHCIDHYFNLDVIGEAEEGAKATYDNQMIMEKAGLSPIPVYHCGEDISWLKQYAEDYGYVGIGGLAGTPTRYRHNQLKRVFLAIADKEGYPTVKLHGFAITSIRTMIEFPWYSVDSTSWVLTSRYGTVYVPQHRDGKWDYTQVPLKIIVSNKNPKEKLDGWHINSLPRNERKLILSYFKSKGLRMGHSTCDDSGNEIIDELGLCNHYVWRDRANIIFFSDLERNFQPWPWPYKPEGVRPFGVTRR